MFVRGDIEVKVLTEKLNELVLGTDEEIIEAFQNIEYAIRSSENDGNSVIHLFEWIKRNSNESIPDNAINYCILALSAVNSYAYRNNNVLLIEAADHILINFSFKDCDKIALNWFEDYLVERLHYDKQSFESLFLDISERFGRVLHKVLKNGRFENLIYNFKQSDFKNLITRMMFTKNSNHRAVGFVLFQEIVLEALDNAIIDTAEKVVLRIALNEFIRNNFNGEDTSRFFLLLEPVIIKQADDIQSFFKDEMKLQAINFPGACLAQWKSKSEKSELFRSITEIAAKYFDNLNDLSKSPLTSFTFPSLEVAIKRGREWISSKVTEETKKHSAFHTLGLIREVSILFGDGVCYYQYGTLTPRTNFTQISHQMEVARLEIVDPEGMSMRRLKAITENKHLEKE